jgi:DNA polymerase elongation subunit (family B)
MRGVVGQAVRAHVQLLLPSVIAARGISAANDDLRALPRAVSALLRERSAGGTILLEAAHGYLGSQGLFSDPSAAAEAAAVARQHTDRVVEELRRRGCMIVELDGEDVACAIPPDWNAATEAQVSEATRAYLPQGVELSFDGRYQSLYARAAGASMTLSADGTVTLLGPAFRAGRLERFGETFLHRAAACLLRGDVRGIRNAFLETVRRLYERQVPLEDLCVRVTLHKTLQQYRRARTHEEPYEALLSAGVRSWRIGQRIRYFRAHGGEPRLLMDGDRLSAADADIDYYIQRLNGLYCQQFAQAFGRDDFARLFRMPAEGWVDDSATLADLAAIRPLVTLVS